MNQANNDQVFRTLYDLIEWAFDIRLEAEDRAIFEAEVFQGWNNADDSDQDFVAYLLHLKDAIWSAPPSRRKMVKPQSRMLFRKIFGVRESNDRGRIVATLHSLIERRAPGITGLVAGPLRVVPPLVAPPSPVPAQPAALPAGTAMAPYASPYAVAPSVQASAQSNNLDSVMRMVKQTQHQAQMIGLQTAIAKTEHDTIMNIIKNI